MSVASTTATAGEVQTVAAARRLKHAKTVFIGVGRRLNVACLRDDRGLGLRLMGRGRVRGWREASLARSIDRTGG